VNYFQSVFTVLAIIMEALGIICTGLSKLYFSGVPMIKIMGEVLKNEKYDNFRTRINLIRDLVLQIITEVALLKSDFKTAIKNNPEDFKSYTDWDKEFGAVILSFAPVGKRIDAAMKEHDMVLDATAKEIKEWMKGSIGYEAMMDATVGRLIYVSEEELGNLVRDQFMGKKYTEKVDKYKTYSHLRENEVELAARIEEDIQYEIKSEIELHKVLESDRSGLKIGDVTYRLKEQEPTVPTAGS